MVRSGHNLIADTLPAAIIAIRAEHGSDITDEQCEANAKLIAASPDLLEACRELTEVCTYLRVAGNDDDPTLVAALSQGNKAIRKATNP